MDRRSFLASVIGAIAVPALGKGARATRQSLAFQRFDDLWSQICRNSPGISYPYMIWDSIKVTPGEALRDQLFPPPIPQKFLIERIGAWVFADAKYPAVAQAYQTVRLLLKSSAQPVPYIEAPLYLVPYEPASPWRLPAPVGDPTLEVWLHTDGARALLDEPVTIGVFLQGLVTIPKRSEQ